MKVLLVPWGDPSNWREINYALDGKKAKSISTLILLAKKYDKVIILSLDSLIDIHPKEDSFIYEDFTSTIGNDRQGGFKNYSSVIRSVNSFVEAVVKRIGVKNVENVVLPAYGSPGGTISFNGKPEDYISVGVWKVEEILEKHSGEINEISLDLTTGMNFTTSLTTIICDMVGDLELAKNREVDKLLIQYYNSEPYNSKDVDREYSIKMVHKVIKDRLTFPYLTIKEDTQDLLKKRSPHEISVEVNKVNEAYSRWVLNTIKAVYFPIPLALKYYAGNTTNTNVLELWENDISVSERCINRNLYLNQNRVYALLYSNIILKNISKTKSIEDIRKESKLIYPKISPITMTLIDKELNNLSNALKKLRESKKEKELYRKLVCPENNMNIDYEVLGSDLNHAPLEEKNSKDIDKRNLLAHAGFLNDYINISSDGTIEYTCDVKMILSLL